MERLLRVIGLTLLVVAAAAILGGMTDDAPGLVLIGLLLAGVGVYALVGARLERAQRR